jgi:hypothetical protein
MGEAPPGTAIAGTGQSQSEGLFDYEENLDDL